MALRMHWSPLVVLVLIGLMSGIVPGRVAAADAQYVFKFYCLDLQPGALERLGKDARTGQLPEELPLAKALALLDQDQVKQVAFSRVEAVIGKEASATNTHKATYLEPAPGGGMVQRQSEWDEGVSVRIVPTIDREGRIHIDGNYALKSINSRAPLVGVEKWDLGRPLTHSTQTVNPAVVLRAGEARLIGALGSGSESERILIVVAEAF